MAQFAPTSNAGSRMPPDTGAPSSRELPAAADRATAVIARSAGLPAFVVIGAMKSGTSSLHHYLGQHPEISMSRVKEPNYFIEAGNLGRGLDWYQSLFADRSKLCGEVSPSYSKRHRHRGVPERLHERVPHVKLIYLLRDPIDRIVSHYLHNRQRSRETRSLAEAVAAKSYRNNYVRTSLYHFQLSAFLGHFPLDRILIATTEDLKERQAETLASVFRFIGVDAGFEGSEFGRLFNRTPAAAEVPKSAETKGRAVTGIIDAALRRLRQTAVAAPRPVLEPADRDRLAERLAPDVERLRALTGLRFERWSL